MTEQEIQKRIEASRLRKLNNPNHPSKMPLPTNFKANEDYQEQMNFIETLLESRDKMAIRYLRDKPSIVFIENKKGVKVPTIAKGDIIGAMVAFRDMNGNVVVGWSKRYDRLDGKGVEIEPLLSNKRRALFAACFRALTDNIHIKSKTYGVNSEDVALPNYVVKELNKFIPRYSKYFNSEVTNVTFYGAKAQAAGA